jgi:hypothetical protein
MMEVFFVLVSAGSELAFGIMVCTPDLLAILAMVEGDVERFLMAGTKCCNCTLNESPRFLHIEVPDATAQEKELERAAAAAAAAAAP